MAGKNMHLGRSYPLFFNLIMAVFTLIWLPGCSSEDRAVAKVTALIQKDPENASLYYRRGKRLEELGEESGSEADFKRALADYDRAVQLMPEKADYHFNRGNVYLSLKNYPAAIKNFQEAISFNPEDADYHNNLGMACAKNMQFTEAVKHFGSAIFLKPEESDFYIGRALVYWEQGDISKARHDYQTAKRLSPDVPFFEELEEPEDSKTSP